SPLHTLRSASTAHNHRRQRRPGEQVEALSPCPAQDQTMPDTVPAKKVLVVEDNAAAREAFALALRRAGYGVTTAADGESALGQLRGGLAPDLLVLDMLMPILDGWHLLDRLRAEWPALPVVVATATILTPEWAADNGCRGLLRKPIDSEALVAEVRRCLGESAAA